MALKVVYLINQYPAVSQTFIRREIEALERGGIGVHRIALRGFDTVLVDESDERERERTQYVLRAGAWCLGLGVVQAAFRRPMKLLLAARLALRLAKGSHTPWPIHLVYLAEACTIQKWVRMTGATHLHAHFATNSAEVAMLVRELGGPPYSFTAHGSDIMDRPAQMGLPEKVGRAAFVVAVCAFGRSQILRWIPPALWGKVSVIGCGLERPSGDWSDEPSNEASRLLCVGRLSPEKGQLLLVEAAALLAATGLSIDIVLAGDGPMRNTVQALIQERGLGERIRITGWLDAKGIEAEMRHARALVVPSLSEGLPVVIMEAMAHRKPVIAPYLAGIPELVTHGETGWLYPAGDVDSMSAAMRACLEAPSETLAGMGDAGFRRVWIAHDVDAEARKLAELFSTPR